MRILIGILLLTATAAIANAQQPFKWVQEDIDTYNLEVVRVDGQRLTARVAELGSRTTFRVPSDFRFYIDGVPTKVGGLSPRQKLRAYVTRGARGELLLVDAGPPQVTPPVTPAAPPVVAAVVAEVPATAMLPKTGGLLPLFALFGLAAFGLAAVTRMARKRMA